MTDDFEKIMAGLPPKRRAKIKTKAAELIAEEMTLQSLRKNQHLTQASLAKTLGIEQGEVSRIEQRSDLYLSTLRKVIGAMGGKLSLIVEMPNKKKVVIKGLGICPTDNGVNNMFVNVYALKVEKDDNGTYLVTAPDFPEVTTFGDDKKEALLNGTNAIEEALAARIADRQDIPVPNQHKGKTTVSLPHQTFLKVVLWHMMKDGHVKKADLARRLGVHAPQIDRLVNIKHPSKPEQIDAAFAAIGKHITAVEVA